MGYRTYNVRHEHVPFNPEFSFADGVPLGHMYFYHCAQYSILRFEGSPKDKRGGCKSVFFVDEIVSQEKLMFAVLNNKAAMDIISGIPNALDNISQLTNLKK